MYLIYKIIYHIVSENTDFDYGYANAIEYMVGIILVSAVTCIIDKVLYKISYKATGSLYASGAICGKKEGKDAHWCIRAVLVIFVFLISLTRLPEMIATPIVHGVSDLVVNLYYSLLNNFLKDILQSIYN